MTMKTERHIMRLNLAPGGVQGIIYSIYWGLYRGYIGLGFRDIGGYIGLILV